MHRFWTVTMQNVLKKDCKTDDWSFSTQFNVLLILNAEYEWSLEQEHMIFYSNEKEIQTDIQ